jgi:hypothetical protein
MLKDIKDFAMMGVVPGARVSRLQGLPSLEDL